MKIKVPILIAVNLLLFFQVSFAQLPNLRSADSFVLFTTTGAFTNTGASYVTGNIGNNAGSFTGFPPGTLIGQKHNIDSVSAKAATDIDSAYSYLGAMTCGTIIGTTLGSNQVLTPGVYCLGGPSVINGTLILDGQGDPNAIFIFKINGALSSSALSNIVLIDSASTCNVYWQVNGAVALGDSSVFRGNILANGSISLLDSAALEGRALTKTGAVNMNNNQVSICYNALIPMPVGLLSFKAERGKVRPVAEISWQSVADIEDVYFDLERSADGVHFSKLSKVISKVNENNVSSYHFTDEHPYPGYNFYRLCQHQVSGWESISNTILLDFSILPADIRWAPNPFSSYFTLTILDASEDNVYHAVIYNGLGEKMYDVLVVRPYTDIDAGYFKSGIYFYHIFLGNEMVRSGKLISQ